MSDVATLVVDRRRFTVLASVSGVTCLVLWVVLESDLSLSVRAALSGLALIAAGVLAMVSCARAAKRSTGRRRRSWQVFGGAALIALVGNAWGTLVGADPVESPSTVTEVCIAVALLLSIAGLLNFPSVRRRGVDLVVMSLDGLVAGGAVLIIFSLLVYSDLLGSATGDFSTRLATVLFPLLDVVLATVSLLLVLRSQGRDREALGLLAAGFILYATADLAFAVLAGRNEFHFGTPLDLVWIAGYVLVSLAAWYPRPTAESPTGVVGISDAQGAAIAFGVLLVAALVQGIFGPGQGLSSQHAVIWLVLILAVGTRQALLIHDNSQLRKGLEARVLEQTVEVRRLARRTEVLLTSVGDGIYGVDAEGCITFVNPSGGQALGYALDDLLGRPAHELFHAHAPDGKPFPAEGCYVAEAIDSGIVSNAEEDHYVRADGTTFPVEITASPLIEHEGRGAVVVFRDVTQRREVERMKNEFLSVVSHELRTPLTSIRGSLGLLASGVLGDLTPRATSMVGIALESSERLTRLINDILDIERMESGTRPMRVAACEVSDLLTTSAEEVGGVARATGVRVEVVEGSGRVLADRDSILQTLTNLLGNAIKYSDAGGTVVLGATERAGQVEFRVHDDGRGIPSDKLESIFERFEQVDSSDARQMGGTGLGLAISRGLVERHGGRIWAESEVGVGTTVVFTLPLSRSDAA